ncbi:unnamed protein product [Linum trigynum]|uniref:Uncharacterized protein n=1 Tax=Linum trigynum TaxID=586398 RepID=A0AAV2FSG3_9ROSI
MGGASAPSKGKTKASSSKVRKMDFDYSSLVPAATEEASSPHLVPPLNPRDPFPEKTLGKRPTFTSSSAELQKKKKKPGLGGIDEILAHPLSRRVVKPKELVPISPSTALNAPSAFTSGTELRNFLKLPLDEGTSPAGSACQHLFQAMLDVVALFDKSLENRERAHKNYLLASQLKSDKAILQGVNSRLGDKLSLVKQLLSDALAAESVSAREEMEKELALRSKKIEDLEKEVHAMSSVGKRQQEFKKKLDNEREDVVDAHLTSAEFRNWQRDLLIGVEKRAFIGIRKKARFDNPVMKWDTPEVWQAMDDYFLSLCTDHEPADSDMFPLDEGNSSADDIEVDVEGVGDEEVGDNVEGATDADAGAEEDGGKDAPATDGQGGASDGATFDDSGSSDDASSKSD